LDKQFEGEVSYLEISDFLYFSGDQYSTEKFIKFEVHVAKLTMHLFANVVTPSETANYILLSVGIVPDDKMLQFIQNLCLHELWQNGSESSPFALAFAAVLVYFEQLNHHEAIRQLILTVHFNWESDFQKFYQEISLIRQRLISSARFLTNDQNCIERFNRMLQHTFEDVVSFILEAAFESPSGNSNNL